jgi:hypothetical protein
VDRNSPQIPQHRTSALGQFGWTDEPHRFSSRRQLVGAVRQLVERDIHGVRIRRGRRLVRRTDVEEVALH